MNEELLNTLPARQGHFLLESGYHTDLWITLGALFVSPQTLAPLVHALAAKLEPHRVTAVCGPFVGGAFLAQALASLLDVEFYYTEPVRLPTGPTLFGAEYRLPDALRPRVRGQRIALVDDVISAGSSVRATAAELAAAGGSTVAVGTLLVLGTLALDHFASLAIPVESLGQRNFELWQPSGCPLCAKHVPLENLVHGRESVES